MISVSCTCSSQSLRNWFGNPSLSRRCNQNGRDGISICNPPTELLIQDIIIEFLACTWRTDDKEHRCLAEFSVEQLAPIAHKWSGLIEIYRKCFRKIKSSLGCVNCFTLEGVVKPAGEVHPVFL